MYKVLDLFCGTGALSYGLSKADSSFVTVGGIDLNHSATLTAQANHINSKFLCGDIEEISPKDFKKQTKITDIDVIVGGPPCQGFSSLRPSRGTNLEDPRNHLYKQFIRYVDFFKPKIFLMENVIGLINANKGYLLDDIIQGFKDIGYTSDWRALNAANYGIPQKRERLFLIGLRQDKKNGSSISFPEPTHFFDGKVIGTKYKDRHITNKSKGKPAVTVWEAISDLPSISSGQSSNNYATPPKNDFQLARRTFSPELTLHQAANHSQKMLEVIRHSGANINALPQGMVTSGYSSCYSRLEKDQPSTTITVKFTSPASSKCIHPFDDRSITPREAARIQSFDDTYIFCGSKTDIASQIGNAVPPLFGSAFAPVLLNLLNTSK